MYSFDSGLETSLRSLIVLPRVSIGEADHFLHRRETSVCRAWRAIANTCNMVDWLRVAHLLAHLRHLFHHVNQQTYTIGHRGELAIDQIGARAVSFGYFRVCP